MENESISRQDRPSGRSILAAATTAAAILIWGATANAFVFTVNSDGDAGAVNPGAFGCATGNNIVLPDFTVLAECTLRSAIEAANFHAGLDRIEWNGIAPLVSGKLEISPASALPLVNDPVFIDGYSHPDYDASEPFPTPIVNLLGGGVAGLSAGLTFGPGSGGSTVRGLAIVNFPGSGILISPAFAPGPQNIVVQGNHLGVWRGVFYVGNGQHGVHLNLVDNNTIGQTCNAISGCRGTRNVISGNTGSGIRIEGGDGNLVAGNFVGTDRTGSLSFVPFGGLTQNAGHGVHLLGNASNNVIGGLGSILDLGGGSTPVASGNVISGNDRDGVHIEDGANNALYANHIGTNAAGTASLANARDGIHDEGFTTIGAEGVGSNLISGNANNGILEIGSSTTIIGNRIGTDASGQSALPNAVDGIDENGTNILIEANIIGGNVVHGLDLHRAGFSQGNWIGTNPNGDDLGNGDAGIHLDASFLQVGALAHGNVIGFNGGHGIELAVGTQSNLIVANWIGTNEFGAALGNTGHGIAIRGIDQTIGALSGLSLGHANTIGENLGSGIHVTAFATDPMILGNFIGTDVTGADLGNDVHGILVENDGATIGALLTDDDITTSRAGNRIANNFRAGIRLPSHVENTFRGNRFRNSGTQPIDIDAVGPTANDFGDTDTGANNAQNHPVFDLVQTQYDDLTEELEIRYLVDSNLGDAAYPITIDFYIHDPWLTPGDEAGAYLGSDSLPAASAGAFRNVSIAPVAGSFEPNVHGFRFGGLRATATDADGNTSELSVQSVPVPEPGFVLALGLGCFLLVPMGARRPRRG